MILDSLYLNNIRSYKELDLEFQKGTTLFEGDIGSGKTTLLMAIEFALFGLGNVKGNSLLRTGEKEGIVRLGFTVDANSYQVQRKLVLSRKSARQSSDDCYIKTSEGILYLSPTELKAKVLEVLNFNEPTNPRAKSVIFTYAVFTPQEEMKTIIFDNPDRRLQTLRKAFRIEDYKTATANANSLASHIYLKSRELKGAANTLEDDQAQKKTLETEKRQSEANIMPLEQQEHRERELRASIQKRLSTLREQQVEISKIAAQIPIVEKRIMDSENEINSLKKEKVDNEKALFDLKLTLNELNAIECPTDKSKKAIELELQQLIKEEREYRGQEVIINNKIQELQSIEERGVCPTCERPADPKEFNIKIQEKIVERKGVASQVIKASLQVEKTRALLNALTRYQHAQQQLKGYLRQFEILERSIKRASSRIAELELQIKEDKSFIFQAQGQYIMLRKVSEKITKLEKDNQTKERLLAQIGKSIATTKQKIQNLIQSLLELDKSIKAKSTQRNLSEDLSEYVIWLRDYFMPTLQTIETTVLSNVQEEFNEKFREWFTILVEDTTKDARVDEDFTPLVEQDGYEQDISFLSGGEKTSVALAYRLALNSLVQKISTGMKSNLLILDEPTDGFSREQLFKVREILNELQCPQVILVSHERELESFADHIFRVVKNNGLSEISYAEIAS